MSERNYVSNRVLLCNASIDVIKDKYEAECLYEYRSIVNKVEEAYEEFLWLSKLSNTSTSIKKIESQIAQYNIQLSRMESEYPLRNVIQRIKGKEQVFQEERKQEERKREERKREERKRVEQTKRKARSPKKKSVIKALNKLYDESVFTALIYIITFIWFGYLVNIVAKSDSHVIGIIFFIVWSLVLAFLFVVHKFGGDDEK
jgi:ABC-type multidrug transport system fused ATPase/permease subunit